ncbi:MAG: hypothetical protein QW474_01185 [Candidatus Aenigmatarchaeota archaeon]
MKIDELKNKAKQYGMVIKSLPYYKINKPECWLIGEYKGIKETGDENTKSYSLHFKVFEGKLIDRDKKLVNIADEECYINTTTSLRKYFLPTANNQKEGMLGKKFAISYKDEIKVKGKKNSCVRYTIFYDNGNEEIIAE